MLVEWINSGQGVEINLIFSMKFKLLAMLILSFATGCIAKHKFTVRLCAGKIYSEVFNVNPAGVDEAFLTDSENFRVYIGKIDNEHDLLRYSCNGDTISVFKFSQDSTGVMKMVDRRALSLRNLSKNKVHSTKPIFEFK